MCVAQEGLGSLRRVLQAFVLDQPEVGYTQSMNYLAVRATQQLAPSLAWPRRAQRARGGQLTVRLRLSLACALA